MSDRESVARAVALTAMRELDPIPEDWVIMSILNKDGGAAYHDLHLDAAAEARLRARLIQLIFHIERELIERLAKEAEAANLGVNVISKRLKVTPTLSLDDWLRRFLPTSDAEGLNLLPYYSQEIDEALTARNEEGQEYA